MDSQILQVGVFFLVTILIGYFTYLKCRNASRGDGKSSKDFFLAGGGLTWFYVAGSITLTNLSTEQLIGMNGSQMALLAWWELAAVVGLIILAKVFIPIYYKNGCTTTTELLEKRYNSKHIRALISILFLLGNVFIFLGTILYTGSLFMKEMFGVELPLMVIAISLASVGGLYAILGGLRAVAVSDTFSGVLLLGMAMLVVFLAFQAVDFDLSGIPAERLTMIGGPDSPIPWTTLFTGMLFIQIYYWSTNQTITQRAMAARTVGEAQKGVLTAAVIRLIIVPPIIVLPGIISYKLYGDIGDAAYGRIVGDLLPGYLSGIFAAAIAAAVLTSYNSVLNSSTTLYVCDIHEKYFKSKPDIKKLNLIISLFFISISLFMVPIYAGSESIINTIQMLYGLLSMPILSAFIVGLLFRNVDAKAAISAVVFGVLLYASFIYKFNFAHFIHMMAVTLVVTIMFALIVNRFVFGRSAEFTLLNPEPKAEPEAV